MHILLDRARLLQQHIRLYKRELYGLLLYSTSPVQLVKARRASEAHPGTQASQSKPALAKQGNLSSSKSRALAKLKASFLEARGARQSRNAIV